MSSKILQVIKKIFVSSITQDLRDLELLGYLVVFYSPGEG
jgi:hypothetical protein